MYTANYKYQLKQAVVAVEPKTEQYFKGIVLQNHMDVYRDSKTQQVITEITYFVQITDGESCTTVKNFLEKDLYASLADAIAANKF